MEAIADHDAAHRFGYSRQTGVHGGIGNCWGRWGISSGYSGSSGVGVGIVARTWNVVVVGSMAMVMLLPPRGSNNT